MSFRIKTVLGIALIEIVLLAILVISGLSYLKSSNEEHLIDQAHTSSRLLATMTADATVSLDLATIQELVSQAIDNPGIVYARVRNADGIVLAEAGNSDVLLRTFKQDTRVSDAGNDAIFDVSSPIEISGTSFGSVEIGLSTTKLSETLRAAGEWMLGIAFSEILLVAAFGSLLGSLLTRQLIQVQDAAARVAAGEFGYTIEVRGSDELAETAYSFNTMSEALLDYRNRAEHVLRETDDRREQAEKRLYIALENIPQAVTIIDGDNNVIHINRSCEELYRLDSISYGNFIPLENLLHMQIYNVGMTPISDATSLKLAISEQKQLHMQLEYLQSGQDELQWENQFADQRIILNQMCRLPDGGRVVVATDVSALHRKAEDRRRKEFSELTKQKLESLGTLAGGVAHELNTPIQFVGSNLSFIKEASSKLISYAKSLEEHLVANNQREIVEASIDRYDVEFNLKELPEAIDQSSDGIHRINDIVKAIKIYAHPGQSTAQITDLSEVIKYSVTVTTNQWNYVAELKVKLDEKLPELMINSGELGQVLVNLIINAADAIKERIENADKTMGLIEITACYDEKSVYLVVSDNGTGMPEKVKKRIFDPFFTTKEVGKGTGQGLSISRAIICKNLDGNLAVDSKPGKGTSFIIQLPRKSTLAA